MQPRRHDGPNDGGAEEIAQSRGDQFSTLRYDHLAFIADVMVNPIQGWVVAVVNANEERITAAVVPGNVHIAQVTNGKPGIDSARRLASLLLDDPKCLPKRRVTEDEVDALRLVGVPNSRAGPFVRETNDDAGDLGGDCRIERVAGHRTAFLFCLLGRHQLMVRDCSEFRGRVLELLDATFAAKLNDAPIVRRPHVRCGLSNAPSARATIFHPFHAGHGTINQDALLVLYRCYF
jgi:hypothetical protein